MTAKAIDKKLEAVLPLLANLNQHVPGGGDALGALLRDLVAAATPAKAVKNGRK
jgi:hypothetical protein